MKKEENKVNFDMSVLTLKELIKVYEDIVDFLQFIEEKKISQDEKEEN